MVDFRLDNPGSMSAMATMSELAAELAEISSKLVATVS
jgi:hypothetical protein